MDEYKSPNRFSVLADETYSSDNCTSCALKHELPNDEAKPISDMIKSDRFWHNHRIVKSPGDGHCFIHSVVFSYNDQISGLITPTEVLQKITHETTENWDKYIPFIENENEGRLLYKLDEYVTHKRYNTSYGDIVPMIVATTLHVNIIIVSGNSDAVDTICVQSTANVNDDTWVVMVYKNGEHYDAIYIETIKQPPIVIPNTDLEILLTC